MRLSPSLIATALIGISITPGAVHAQEEAPPTHYLSVTTFQVPYDADARQTVNWWIDSVMVPTAKMNPSVRSYRVANHIYGARGGDIVIVTEYADWNAINADCEPCSTWFQNRQPAEGTPEREAWNAAQAMFFKYFTGHHDEVYVFNMSRAK